MIEIRPTAMQDLVHIAALEGMTDTAAWLGQTGLAWHERALIDPDQEHLVTGDGATLTGFLILAGLHDSDQAIELRRMVVHPAARGTGHGRALLRAALTRAYEHHLAHRVWLDVKAHNLRARTLYESEGFVATDTITNAVTERDGATTDLLAMVHRPG